MDTSQPVEQLTALERSRLAADEAIIEAGIKTFYEVGAALQRIRDGRLYKSEYASFEAYCRERWGMGRSHAYRLIDSAEIYSNLSPMGDMLPVTERELRPLGVLEPEQQRAAWQEAIATAPNGNPTAGHVARVVEQFKVPAREFFDNPAPYNGNMAVHYSSATPEWYTPQHIIDRVVGMFEQIDLDPCSNSKTAPTVPALNHYTVEDDGLAQFWHGYVYMNPPYGEEIARWVDKLVTEYDAGRVALAIALVPARVDTRWWAQLARFPVCFIRGRLKFSSSEDSAPFPSAVVYLGDDTASFIAEFGPLGALYAPLV